MGCGAFAAPGIFLPRRPVSTAGEAPKRLRTLAQKFVFPAEVRLMDPDGSATASYVRTARAGSVTRLPEASTTCAWIVL